MLTEMKEKFPQSKKKKKGGVRFLSRKAAGRRGSENFHSLELWESFTQRPLSRLCSVLIFSPACCGLVLLPHLLLLPSHQSPVSNPYPSFFPPHQSPYLAFGRHVFFHISSFGIVLSTTTELLFQRNSLFPLSFFGLITKIFSQQLKLLPAPL